MLFLAFFITNSDKFSSANPRFIDGDGSGLYAYLPQLLFYHSVDFSKLYDLEKQQKALDYTGHYFHEINGITINKFSSGTALLQIPFFLLAWVLSLILGLPADGYSFFFQYSVAFAALFWALIGLKFLIKMASSYGVPENRSLPASLLGFLGTNLFYYTVGIPSASHVYSFAIISVYAYFIRKTFICFENRWLYLSAFLFGMVVLIRPVNVVVLAAIPFLAETPENLFHVFKKKFSAKVILIIFLVFLLAISPQLLINFLQTGNLFVYAYKNEGFIFTDPAILHFLFSYRKGWFLYTPIMLLLFPALVFLWKKSKYQFWTFLYLIILVVFVFSSWWNWIYGDSFGMRPMIDFYSIFFLLILLFFNSIKNKMLQISLLVFVALSILLNLFQSYQYKKKIIHPDSMSREAYWFVFLKTGKEYESAVSEKYEYFYGKLSENEFFNSEYTIDENNPEWTAARLPVSLGQNRNVCAELNAEVAFSPTLEFEIGEKMASMNNIYVKFSADYMENTQHSAGKALFVADISDSSRKTLFYKSFNLKALPDDKTGVWKKAEIGFKLPEIKDDFAQIKFYIWNIEGQQFYVDNLRLRFYTYSN